MRQGYEAHPALSWTQMADVFDESYRDTPPWDVGHPQAEFVRLANDREARGRVLDVGCGTGENAIFFAGSGLETWGIDGSPPR